MSVYRISPVTLGPGCACCEGSAEGIGRLCPECENAFRSGDRSLHPHEFSPEQLAAIAESEALGRRPGGIIQDIEGLGSPGPDGIPVIQAILVQDQQDWPEGHPCRDCGRLFAAHSALDLVCEGWR